MDIKVYKSHDAFKEDFVTGKILSSVIVKFPDGNESIHVCHEERVQSRFVLERLKFKDEEGCTRFNLYYAPIFYQNKKDNSMMFFVERDQIHKVISGFVIIHPMLMLDWKYKKSKGHTVLTECWRIRTARVWVTLSLKLQTFVCM